MSVLQTAIGMAPNDASLHHMLGLALVRLKKPEEALHELHRASELAPDRVQYSYVYAVALHSADRKNEAMGTLEAVLARNPGNRNVLLALMTFSRDAGQLTVALSYAEQLAKLTPNDRGLAAFIQALKQKLDGSDIPR